MKSLIFIVVASASLVQGQQALGRELEEFLCDVGECQNGIFNQGLCKCECIPPYCPGLNGDCTNPSNSCGGNPWNECVKGVNCPWWKNLLKQESCTTGWQVGPTLLFHLRRPVVRLSSIMSRLIECIDFTLRLYLIDCAHLSFHFTNQVSREYVGYIQHQGGMLQPKLPIL